MRTTFRIVLAARAGSKIYKKLAKIEKEVMWSHTKFKKKGARHDDTKKLGVTHNFAFPVGAQVAKIAQVVGENQNFEGLKNAIQILIFVCRYMFLFLFAAILQKCASGSSGKHSFANCIFDANP